MGSLKHRLIRRRDSALFFLMAQESQLIPDHSIRCMNHPLKSKLGKILVVFVAAGREVEIQDLRFLREELPKKAVGHDPY